MATKVRQNGRAGIYVRISRDHATEASTDVQEAECRKLCEARGWPVADVYADVGRSAFKRETVRPAFDRLRADIDAEASMWVVAYKVDRIARNVGDFVGFRSLTNRPNEEPGAPNEIRAQRFARRVDGMIERTVPKVEWRGGAGNEGSVSN